MDNCTTPGHEHKPAPYSGLCQACYRKAKRRERGLLPPGPKPKPGAVSHRKLSDEERAARAADRKAAKTHCVQGHELTPENTYTTPRGQKVCRICQRVGHQRSLGRPVDATTPIGTWNRNKTHCPKQHPYEKFGFVKSDGARGCRICRRAGWIQRIYGVTPQRWDAMVLEQEGRCANCEEDVRGKLCVDHDHACCPGKTSCGKCVRDLLCSPCNRAIGVLRENPRLLRAAATYLEKHL